MSEGLKRCPFCGGRAVYSVFSDRFKNKIAVVCSTCGARTTAINETVDFCAKDRVKDLWNKRDLCSEWIPVKKQLPGSQRAVLVHVQYPEDEFELRVAYCDGKEWKDFYSDDGEILGPVVAWMELPKYYTGYLK